MRALVVLKDEKLSRTKGDGSKKNIMINHNMQTAFMIGSTVL